MKFIKSVVSVLLSVILSSYLLLFSLVINYNGPKKPLGRVVFIDQPQTGVSIALGQNTYRCGYMKFIPTEHERVALGEKCIPKFKFKQCDLGLIGLTAENSFINSFRNSNPQFIAEVEAIPNLERNVLFRCFRI